jgi:hypothetical protein
MWSGRDVLSLALLVLCFFSTSRGYYYGSAYGFSYSSYGSSSYNYQVYGLGAYGDANGAVDTSPAPAVSAVNPDLFVWFTCWFFVSVLLKYVQRKEYNKLVCCGRRCGGDKHRDQQQQQHQHHDGDDEHGHGGVGDGDDHDDDHHHGGYGGHAPPSHRPHPHHRHHQHQHHLHRHPHHRSPHLSNIDDDDDDHGGVLAGVEHVKVTEVDKHEDDDGDKANKEAQHQQEPEKLRQHHETKHGDEASASNEDPLAPASAPASLGQNPSSFYVN